MIQLNVSSTRVVVPVGFETLAPQSSSQVPSIERPEVDDRTFGTYETGMIWGSAIEVRLLRMALDNAAPLTLRARNGHVTFPRGASVGSGNAVIRIEAPAAPNNADATDEYVDVYWNAVKLATLNVKIYALLRVPTNFYFCACLTSDDIRVTSDGGTQRANVMRMLDASNTEQTQVHAVNRYLFMTPTFEVVNAIWRPAGVEFVHGGAVRYDGIIHLPNMHMEDGPRVFGDTSDLSAFLGAAPVHAANEVNIYFVHRPAVLPYTMDNGNALWTMATTYSFDPWDASTRADRPCILAPLYRRAEQAIDGNVPPDGGWIPVWTGNVAVNCGTVLAHELGHLFGLRHPSDRHGAGGYPHNASNRLLMHNADSLYLIPHTRLMDDAVLNDNGVATARASIRQHARLL